MLNRSGLVLLLTLVLSAQAFARIPSPSRESSYKTRFTHSGRVIKDLLHKSRSTMEPVERTPWGNESMGTRVEELYQKLTPLKAQSSVIVAVIDTGVDIQHPDLKSQLWVNEKEHRGIPGVDDDSNGYVDDVYGWNFLGKLSASNYEASRLVGALELKERASGLSESEKKELTFARELHEEGISDFRWSIQVATAELASYRNALKILRVAGLEEESESAVKAVSGDTQEIRDAQNLALRVLVEDRNSEAGLVAAIAQARADLVNLIDLSFDPSSVIGDNPKDFYQVGYGDPRVWSGRSDHGTHCAGTIAATRDNGFGVKGYSNAIKIMSLRAVPDEGDERDKDVAAAVRYAVRNGAHVISMSFAKSHSPNSAQVYQAFKEAEAAGVVVVHAAGNSSRNIDNSSNYPSAERSLKNKAPRVKTWIEVGASSSDDRLRLPAGFSNYGKLTVDLFAPGVDVRSTVRGGRYDSFDGTSMATPNVAGVVGLMRSLFPQATGEQVRQAVVTSARSFKDRIVQKPGTWNRTGQVPFSELSVSGGVADAVLSYETLSGAKL